MCLAVPGKIISIEDRDGTLMSIVDFGGIKKDVCLQYIPDAEIGEYVVVHVGFALQRLDEESAIRTLAEFEHLGVLKEEFGDGFELAAKQAGPAPIRRCCHEISGRIQRSRTRPQARRPDQERDHPTLVDHGSVWRADTFDHSARHRPTAPRHDRDDPRPGMPGLRHPAGGHRQGIGDRVTTRRDLLFVRRHASRPRQREGSVPGQEPGRRRPGGVFAAGCAQDRARTTPTSRWCSSVSGSRRRRPPTR